MAVIDWYTFSPPAIATKWFRSLSLMAKWFIALHLVICLNKFVLNHFNFFRQWRGFADELLNDWTLQSFDKKASMELGDLTLLCNPTYLLMNFTSSRICSTCLTFLGSFGFHHRFYLLVFCSTFLTGGFFRFCRFRSCAFRTDCICILIQFFWKYRSITFLMPSCFDSSSNLFHWMYSSQPGHVLSLAFQAKSLHRSAPLQ